MQHIYTPVWHKRTSLKYDLIGLQHLTTWIKTLLISPGEVLAEDIDQALNPTGITRVGSLATKTLDIDHLKVASWTEKPNRTVPVWNPWMKLHMKS